jgi:hypothetical protein
MIIGITIKQTFEYIEHYASKELRYTSIIDLRGDCV